MNLETTLTHILPLDQAAMQTAKRRWDSIAKPLGSLGLLETAVIQLAGIQRTANVRIDRRAIVVMCADNGVVAESVTQTGSEVTAIVAENFTKGQTSLCAMARLANAAVHPVDIGMLTDVPAVENRKIAYGTRNMAHEPAMTRAQAVAAIEVGIDKAQSLIKQGVNLLATGEMGIGNTTTSSAVAAVLLNQPVEAVTGRGAGLTSTGLAHKIEVIQRAIALHQPDPSDPLDVLAKLGGFDLAGLVGVYLGGAAMHTGVLVDGFISAAAALIAARLCPAVQSYLLPSHVSKEPAGQLVLAELGLRPFLHADLCLGEGTGAVAAMPILDMANAVYREMSTFEDIAIDAYQELK